MFSSSRNVDRRRTLAGLAPVALALLVVVEPVAAQSSAAAETRPALRTVPEPATGHFEAEVRLQLDEERARLETTAAGEPSPAALSEAYGRLGQLYYLYQLTGPAKVCFLNARDVLPEDPRWHYFLAGVHRREGDLEQSVEALERTLALAPDDSAALIRLGDASIELGRFDESAQAYRRALYVDGSAAAALYGLGRLAAIDDRPEEAIEMFERALALQPAATSIHHRLGMAHRALGDLDAAKRHFDRNTGGPVKFDDPLHHQLQRLTRSTQVLFNAGVEAARQGQFEEAITLLRRAVAADPSDAVVLHNLALVELRSGRRDDAIRDLRKSVELDPEVRNVQLKLGTLLAEDGRLVEAEVHLRRAHEIDPEDDESHLQWATALSLLGRADQALDEVTRLLERDASSASARLVFGVLNADLGRDAVALAALERVTQAARASAAEKAKAHYHLALLHERSGDVSAAESDYRAATALASRSADYLEALALFLGRLGRFREAAEAYESVIAAEEERASAYFGRAMALLLDGRYAETRAELEASMARRPGDLGLAHLMARLLVAAPDEGVRDGRRGHQLALSVYRAAPSIDHAQTVAMALAELGRFDEAAELQREVLAEVESAASPSALEQVVRRRLESYLQTEPCRAPWLESGR